MCYSICTEKKNFDTLKNKTKTKNLWVNHIIEKIPFILKTKLYTYLSTCVSVN